MPEPLSDDQITAMKSRLNGGSVLRWADATALLAEVDRLRTALAAAEGLAAEYGARIVAASMAAAPLDDGDEWVRCGTPHCPNAERFQYADQRGWTHGGMGTMCCPEHTTPAAGNGAL